MKIIDLLNKIANGEEVPKKICYDLEYYNYIDGAYETELRNDLSVVILLNKEYLNDEVAIIEDEPKEHKIPEKLPLQYPDNRKPEEEYEYLRCKINEIIDYLEEIK